MMIMQHILYFLIFTFFFGLSILIIRKNFLFTLISLEIMIVSISLSFILSSNLWQQIDGNIMFLLIISLSAAEISIGLSLLLKIHRAFNTLNIDIINEIKK